MASSCPLKVLSSFKLKPFKLDLTYAYRATIFSNQVYIQLFVRSLEDVLVCGLIKMWYVMQPLSITGWGQHMISNMKYHFVVPSKETAAMASTCLSCQGNNCCADGTILAASCGASKSSSLVELEGHTLHGVFHCNGFGHLLCVNGLEMGSDLNGHQIMDFWDRICTTLRAR